MLFSDHPVVVRGGGDLGTGVVWRLHSAGFPVVVLELPEPLVIRRKVSLASAIYRDRIDVEGLVGVRLAGGSDPWPKAVEGIVPVIPSPALGDLRGWMVVDARMAKRNIDTSIDDADLVVGLGPGFFAGRDCHAVVETMRGPRLGRVLWDGPAAQNTGSPGSLGGKSSERVVRAPAHGVVTWDRNIGESVVVGDRLGRVGDVDVLATITGLIRGMIFDGHTVTPGMKIGDIDPRGDAVDVSEISDKALAIGGGVLEAALSWLNR